MTTHLFRRVILSFQRLKLPQGGAGRRDLRSGDDFKDALEMERSRARRSGGELSLLVFRANSGRTHSAVLDELAHVLSRRLRVTDTLGWFDASGIGALLPDTPASGARKLAADIAELCALRTDYEVEIRSGLDEPAEANMPTEIPAAAKTRRAVADRAELEAEPAGAAKV